MKKITLLVCLLAIFICGCTDTRIRDKKNINWETEFLDLSFTYEQLQKQSLGETKSDTDYSKLTVEGKTYNCIVLISNKSFRVILVGDSSNNDVFDSYYDDFLLGRCSSITPSDKGTFEYQFTVKLQDACQYFSYCQKNSVDFPEEIVIYGRKR